MAVKFTQALPQIRLVVAMAVFALAFSVPALAADKADKADKNEQGAYDESDVAHRHHAAVDQHVEGHIAFLHAELGITPEQEQLWSAVASAMRQDVKDMEAAEDHVAQHQTNHETAIHYLKNREMFANLRAQGESRFLAAMQPLYDNLSAQQKQAADDLLVATSVGE